jgi:hypothetical protein
MKLIELIIYVFTIGLLTIIFSLFGSETTVYEVGTIFLLFIIINKLEDKENEK